MTHNIFGVDYMKNIDSFSTKEGKINVINGRIRTLEHSKKIICYYVEKNLYIEIEKLIDKEIKRHKNKICRIRKQ